MRFNLIIDNTLSMNPIIDCVNRDIASLWNIIKTPFLLEEDSLVGMCTFNKNVSLQEPHINDKCPQVECSESIITNIEDALLLCHHANWFCNNSINFIIIDGEPTDIKKLSLITKEIDSEVSHDRCAPAFFVLALGPIADVIHFKNLRGYGYRMKEANSEEGRTDLSNFMTSVINHFAGYYPSLTLDPLVNQFRPRIPEQIKQIYEIEY